jgi:hypothetical protein
LKTAFVFAAALAFAGCGGKKEDKPVEKTPAGSGSAVATTTGSATSGSAAGSAAGSAVDVPTEEDFEAQAKTDITTANVDTKVKAIEDQLGSN